MEAGPRIAALGDSVRSVPSSSSGASVAPAQGESLGCSPLACDDDGGSGTLSLINYAVTGGVTYYISVEGWNGGTGNYQLNINYI